MVSGPAAAAAAARRTRVDQGERSSRRAANHSCKTILTVHMHLVCRMARASRVFRMLSVWLLSAAPAQKMTLTRRIAGTSSERICCPHLRRLSFGPMSPHGSPSTGGVLHLVTAETRALSGPSVTAEDAAAYGAFGTALRPSDVRSTGTPAPLLGSRSGVSTPDSTPEHHLIDDLGRGVAMVGVFRAPVSASGHLSAAASAAWSSAWQPVDGGDAPSAGSSSSAGVFLSQQASAAGIAPSIDNTATADPPDAAHAASVGSFGSFGPAPNKRASDVIEGLPPSSAHGVCAPARQAMILPSQQCMKIVSSSGGCMASADMDEAFCSPPPASTFRIRRSSSVIVTDEEQDESPPKAPSKPCLAGIVQRTVGHASDTASSMPINTGPG